MPGKSDACQADVAAIAHRDSTRRSDPMIGNAKLGSTASSRRGSAATGSENLAFGGVRRSPRLGTGNCTAQSRLARTAGGPRVNTGLTDITNVTASRLGQQAFGKSQGKPATATGHASVPVPDRPPSAQTSRQLSARGGSEAQSQQVTATPALPAPEIVENAQNCQEYAAEIVSQFFRDESNFLPRPNYMESQTDINGKMRAILIDWLVEVHMKYKLRPETLFLTVNLIDRYLSQATVMRKKLQLVGVVAMAIASKFEEINPPEVHDFVHITDNAYTKDDVLVMECMMLTALNFQIVVPTATHFFEHLQKLNRCDDTHREVAEYIIELGLLDMRMLRYTPSHLVSAALLLSNELLNKRPAWPQLMVQQSQHSEQALRACADEYKELLDAAAKNPLQAVWKKFAVTERHSVSRMTF